MRVFLTGATGFVGAHLLDRLLADRGHEVGILLRASSDPWRIARLLDRCTTIRGDLADLEAARPAIVAFNPEVILHLGWAGVGRRSRDDPSQVENIRSTVTLVDIAREAGARAWIGLGSQAEYGPHDHALNEQVEPQPTTLYGIAKLSAKQFAERLCIEHRMRFAWLRLFSCYGPMDDPSTMVSSLILTLLRGDRPALTEGTQLWDYVHVVDVVRAIERVSLDPGLSGVFNLGSGQTRTIRSLVEQIRDLIDPNLPLGFGEVPSGPGQVMHLEADVSRLRDGAGWSPTIDLEEGMRQTVDWFRDHHPFAER